MSTKIFDILSISTNQLDGYSFFQKFGRNQDIDSGTVPETVWALGGMYVPPTAARTHQVSSSSVTDAGSGVTSGNITSFNILDNGCIEVVDTGATFVTDSVSVGDAIIDNTRTDHSVVVSIDSETQITIQPLHDNKESKQNLTVRAAFVGNDYDIITPTSTGAAIIHIIGLDGNLDEIEEFVITNGTNDVATSMQYLRINRAHIDLAGSANVNVGDISIIADTDATTSAYIAAGDGQTLQLFYSVPNNKTAFMTNISMGTHRIGPVANTMASASLRTTTFIPEGNIDIVEDTLATVLRGTTTSQKFYEPYKIFKQRTDIWLQVDYVSDNNINVSGSFDIILIDNDKM